MGAGRKTSTYDIDTKAAGIYEGFTQAQRKLGEDKLGGCIFGCTNETFDECVDDLVFGLPRSHWLYVQNISKGLPIFLYNYQTKRLHGIFKAVSNGELDIKPEGWCRIQGTRTQYPAQVKVEIYADCEALVDKEYRPILKECMMEDGKFVFELKKTEAQNLCRAFDEKSRRMPSQSSANSGSRVVSEKPTYRPASPPAVPAWGAPKIPAKTVQEVPKDSDFPSLSSGSATAPIAQQASQRSTSQEETSSKPTANSSSTRVDTSEATKPKQPPAQSKVEEKPAKREVSPAPANPKPPGAKPSATAQPSPTPNGVASTAKKPTSKSVPAKPASAPASSQEVPTKPPSTKKVEENGHREDTASQPKRPSLSTTPSQGSPAKQPKLTNHSPHTPPQGETAQAGSNPASRPASGSKPPQSSTQDDLQGLRDALGGLDPRAAQAMVDVVSKLKSQLTSLARYTATLQSEKQELQEITRKQNDALDAFREEAIALRKDVSFMGQHVGINVVPENLRVSSIDIQELVERPQHPGRSLPVEEVSFEGPIADVPPPDQLPANESLLIFGGNNSNCWLKNVDELMPSQSSWTEKSEMPEARGYGAAAAIEGSVYLMGGGNGKKWYNSCLRFDVHEGCWFKMADMEEQRGSLGAAALNGKVYAVGGGKPGIQSNTMEILDVKSNVWMSGKMMKSKRFAIHTAVMNHSLYVVGGFSDSSYLASGERHDPREGFWDELPEMKHRRGGHAMVAVDSELYVLGGWNNDLFMNQVEVYDARANAWREMASLKTPHAYFSAAHLDGRLYVLGGMADQQNFNDLVEVYEPSENRWKGVLLNPTDDEYGRKRAFIASCKMTE